MDDKAGAEKLQGFWVVEIGELAGMKKADIEKVKSFLSTSDDKYRPSYGRVVKPPPARCVIIGTVNGRMGLPPVTSRATAVSGSSKCIRKTQKQSWHFTQADRDQFWARRRPSGSPASCIRRRYLAESRENAAERYGGGRTCRHGRGVSEHPPSRRMGRYGCVCLSQFPLRSTAVKGATERTTVTNAEIWCECFGQEPLRTEVCRQLCHQRPL